jgi:hypothetical protein
VTDSQTGEDVGDSLILKVRMRNEAASGDRVAGAAVRPQELRVALEEVRKTLVSYVDLLGEVAGVLADLEGGIREGCRWRPAG